MHQHRKTSLYAVAALACCLSWPSAAQAQFILDLPGQKVLIAVPTASYTRETNSRSIKGSLPFGFAAEYSLFVKRQLAVAGQFAMNIDSATESVVFMGGGAGAVWYMVGGATNEYNGSYVETATKPKFNVYSILGFSARSFDFTAIDEKERLEKQQGLVRDKKDSSKGSFTGLMLALGGEYPVDFNLWPGFRVQYIKSFSSATQPDFTLTEMWLSVAFTF